MDQFRDELRQQLFHFRRDQNARGQRRRERRDTSFFGGLLFAVLLCQAIKLVWSSHREILYDYGPVPADHVKKQS